MGHINKVSVSSSVAVGNRIVELMKQIPGMDIVEEYVDPGTYNEFHIFKYRDTNIRFSITVNSAHAKYTYSIYSNESPSGYVYFSGNYPQGITSYNSGIWSSTGTTDFYYVNTKNGIYISNIENSRNIVMWEEDGKVFVACFSGSNFNIYYSYGGLCDKMSNVVINTVLDSSNVSRSVMMPWFYNTPSPDFKMYSTTLYRCLSDTIRNLSFRSVIYFNGVPYIKIAGGGYDGFVQIDTEVISG